MKHSTKINGIFCGALFLAAGAAMTLAVPDRAWSGSYASRSRISEFESFMSEHPKASTELRLNPNLVYNRKWLDKHPEVDHFLKGRPELRETIARKPGYVFSSYGRADRRYNRRDYDRFDQRDRPWSWSHR
ncbi:MAG: hypothetical protein ACREQO_26205 [Candidatus Binatia bacterium]